jgi:hypothetical protein
MFTEPREPESEKFPPETKALAWTLTEVVVVSS